MKLLVLKGGSQNGVLTAMSERLADAFTGLGVEARVIAVDHQSVVGETVGALAGGGFDTVLSFAGFGAEIATPEGLSLYDATGVRFIGWAVDHPAFHMERYVAEMARRYTLCAAPSHFAFLDAAGVRGAQVPLLAGTQDFAALAKPFARRSHRLLLAASWIGAPRAWWEDQPGTPVAAIGAAVMGRLMDDPAADLLAAWREALATLGYELPLDGNTARLLAELMLTARRHDRLRLVEAAAARGLPLTLCGDGWDGIEAARRFKRVESLGFEALAPLYGDARVVVNLNAGNGASERALAALSAGAAVASDDNPLLEAAFPRGVRFYDRTDMEKAADVLGDLVESDAAEALAEAGAARVRAEHLWSDRAKTILKAVEAAEGPP